MHITLRPSRFQALFTSACIVLALLCICYSGLHLALKWFLGIIVMVNGIWRFLDEVLICLPSSIVAIDLDRERGVMITQQNGIQIPVRVSGDTVVLRFGVWLVFYSSRFRGRRWLTVYRDQCEKERFRELKAGLRGESLCDFY